MVECPRCGFIQPDDRYCANCGLDSATYTPKPVPLYLRIINNTGVQLTAALLIVASLIFGLYKNQQNHLELAINKAEEAQRQHPTPTVNAKILPARPAEPPRPAARETVPADEQTMDMAAREKSSERAAGPEDAQTSAASSAATAVPSAVPAAGAPGDSRTFPFTVSLVELSREVLAGLAQVRPVKTWARTRAWIITNFQGGQELATYSQSRSVGQAWNIDIPNKDRGLYLEVTPMAGSNDSHLKVMVKTRFRWPSEQPGQMKGNEISIEGAFDIPSQNHLVITGIISLVRNITMTEATLIQSTPLALLATENFQNQSSDLGLTIQ